jgi:hypothetical protein
MFLQGQPDGPAIICLLRVNPHEGVCAAIGTWHADISVHTLIQLDLD